MVSFSCLCQKDVISVVTGHNLGRVDDLEFLQETATVEFLIVYGRLKWWGLFGRKQDIKIPWKDVITIGRDVILINTRDNNENCSKSNGYMGFD